MVKFSDSRLSNWSTWCSETYTCSTTHTPACEQVTGRGHPTYHPMFTGRGFHRFEADRSAYTRVSVLAQGHRLDARKLDIDIQRTTWLGKIEPGANPDGPSESTDRHAHGQSKPRVL